MNEQNDAVIRRLIERLSVHDPVTRRNAAGALRLHGAQATAAIPALRVLLDDDDFCVRREARRALERLDVRATAKEVT